MKLSTTKADKLMSISRLFQKVKPLFWFVFLYISGVVVVGGFVLGMRILLGLKA